MIPKMDRLIVDFELISKFVFLTFLKLFFAMKKFLFSTVLVFTICLVSMGQNIVAKGESNSVFGNYKIVLQEDHMLLNNKELDKYLITYDKSDLKVMVVVDKQKKCKKYYVLSEKIPVQYECNGTYFGIKKLDKALLSEGYNTSMNNLNKEEFYHQKVLTSETTKTIDHLVLIASYYPGLFI
jgi:hypothetical protein